MFRKEVVLAKKNRLTGNVILSLPSSIYINCCFTFFIFALACTYLTQANYSRKETVEGYLIPRDGLIKLYPERTGVVEELLVTEGSYVTKGQPIAKIKNSQSLATGIELSMALGKEITEQISELEQELNVTDVMLQKDLLQIDQQIDQKNNSLAAFKKALATTNKKLKIKNVQYANNQSLHQKGFLSTNQLSIAQEEYLDALQESERLHIEMMSVSSDISILESEKKALPDRALLKKTTIARQISELKAKSFELNNQYELIEKSPSDGMVTAIQSELGSRVNMESPILSIIPINSPLEIELLLPTRSAGFVKIGDQVQIRFNAFPYQKFGLVSGEVINIDKSLILPNERILPIQSKEAVYRVRAKLAYQAIPAYGKTFPLKVGMIGDADIILEKRTLLEWLLDPIYSLKGKLG